MNHYPAQGVEYDRELIRGFVQFLNHHPDLFSSILRASQQETNSRNRTTILAAVLPFAQLQEALDQFFITLKSTLNLSEKKLLTEVRHAARHLEPVIGDIVNVRMSQRKYRRLYHHMTLPFRTRRLHAEYNHYVDNKFQRFRKKLVGAFYPIFNVIVLDLSTETIRKAMHFTELVVGVKAKLSLGIFLDYKITRDGFRLSTGQMVNLITATLLNVRGMASSSLHANPIAICSCDEDRFNLHLFMQTHDVEIFMLRTFGVPDPKSGQLLGLKLWNNEDSASMDKSLGKRPANTGAPYMHTPQSVSTVGNKSDIYHVPMSLHARASQKHWDNLVEDNVNSHVRGYFAQFKYHEDFTRYVDEQDDLNSIWSSVRRKAHKYGHQIGDWLRAEDLFTLGIDGLHLEMRIFIIVLKYILISTILYFQFKMQDNADHVPKPKRMSLHDMLVHINCHCYINFRWDPDQPTNSNIDCSMLYFVSHCDSQFTLL